MELRHSAMRRTVLFLLTLSSALCQKIVNVTTEVTTSSGEWIFDGSTLRINARDGNFTIHSIAHTFIRGDRVEVNSSVLLCVGFLNATAYTRVNDSEEDLARVEVDTSRHAKFARIYVDRDCWRHIRDIASCNPVPLGDEGMHIPFFQHSPLSLEFWSREWDHPLFDPGWLEGLSIYISAGNVFPNEWISLLNVSSLSRLEISGNKWSRLSLIFKHLPSLESLNLSRNSIHDLIEGTFINNQLKSLNVSYNNITRFPDWLNKIPITEELDLSNQISETAFLIPDDVVKLLGRLKHLHLQNTPLRGNIRSLLNLPYLISLNLSRSSLSDTLNNVHMCEYASIRSLDVSYNNLTVLSSTEECLFLHLHEIHVQGNLFHTCPISDWHLPEMEILSLNRNNISFLTKESFARMKVLKLLHLAWNNISYLDMSWFASLSELRYLCLSHNKISSIQYSMYFIPGNLMLLDISFNEITNLPKISNVICESVNMSHNSLQSFQVNNKSKIILNLDFVLGNDFKMVFSPSQNSIYLRNLDQSYRDLTSIPKTFSLHTSEQMLKRTNGSFINNEDEYSTHDVAVDDDEDDDDDDDDDEEEVDDNGHMIDINIYGNSITDIEIAHVDTTKVKLVDLSWNQIISITNLTFDSFKSLVNINLSHNKIYYIQNESFSHLTTLKILDISSNNLQVLSFAMASYLNKLFASENNLSSINITSAINYLDLSRNNVIHLMVSNVSHVNLSYNSLRYINSDLIKVLPNVATMDLGGNEFHCCHADEFPLQSILADFTHTIRNLNTSRLFTTCYLNEEEPFFSLSQTVNDLTLCDTFTKKETSMFWVMVGTVIGILIILTYLVSYIYNHRNELVFMNHLKAMQIAGLEEDDAQYDNCIYDAFVCHSSYDFGWVKNQLTEQLENDRYGYRFCIHCRDFPLGSRIDENIQHALEKSRKVIFILSERFLNSDWCEMELNLAKHKMIREKRNYIILVELQRVNSRRLSETLKYLMDTRTYLEWPENEHDVQSIGDCWVRLRRALGDSIKRRIGVKDTKASVNAGKAILNCWRTG